MTAPSSSLALHPPPSPTRTSSTILAVSPFSGNIDLVHQWDEDTVGEWLKSVNCAKYRSVFVSNNINGDALLDCDQNILKEVGVNKVGDRIRIMVAVKALRAHAASLNKVMITPSIPSQEVRLSFVGCETGGSFGFSAKWAVQSHS